MMMKLTSVATLAAIIGGAQALFGATVTWDNGAGDGQWGSAENWDTDALPGENDAVIIPTTALPEDGVIHLGADRQVADFGTTGKNGRVAIIDGADGKGGLYTLKLGQLTKCADTTSPRFRCRLEPSKAGEWKANGWGSYLYFYGPFQTTEDYKITLSGSQNSRVTEFADIDLAGDLVVKNYELNLGSKAAQMDADGVTAPTGGRIVNAKSIELTNDGLNYNANSGMTLTIFNTLEAIPNRINPDIPLRITGSGATFKYWGHATETADQHFNDLRLESNRFFIQPESGAEANPCTVFIDGYTRNPGATFECRLNAKAKIRVAGAQNTHGMWVPWGLYLQAQSFLKVNESDLDPSPSIISVPDADYVELAASGNEEGRIAKCTVPELTLAEDADIWALRFSSSTSVKSNALHLADHRLFVGSGAMICRTSYDARIDAGPGGALVFGGEDIVLSSYQGNNGTFEISAPLEWRKPTGSTVQYPSIAIPQLYCRAMNGERRGMVLSGEDRITNYWALATASITDDNSNSSFLVFAGDSDRNFFGPVSGTGSYRKEGRGTLRFYGEYAGRIAAPGIEVAGGTVIYYSTPHPVKTIASGASVLFGSESVNTGLKPNVQSGARIGGLGKIGQATLGAGSIVAPGLEGVAGEFTYGGNLTLTDDLTIEVFADDEANSCLKVSGQMSFSSLVSSGKTLTFCVTDPSKGQVNYRNREFPVLCWTGALSGSVPPNDNVRIVSGSPRTIDVSQATWRYDSKAKTIYLSGIRSIKQGLAVIVR